MLLSKIVYLLKYLDRSTYIVDLNVIVALPQTINKPEQKKNIGVWVQETYHDWQRLHTFDSNEIVEHILGYGVVAVVFTPRHACGSTPGFDLINIRIY